MADYDLQYQDTHIDALLATANELKTAGYIYKGVATPSTNPGTPTERVAYLASEPGTYTNFGGIVITSGLYSLTYASGTWTGTLVSAGSDIEVVQTTGQSTSDVMSQKATTDELNISKNYLEGDLRLLGLGQGYSKGEIVKNSNSAIVKVTQVIRPLALATTYSVNDIAYYNYNGNTYKILKNILNYSDIHSYTSGMYAIVEGVTKKYNGSTWSAVTLAQMAADTALVQTLTTSNLDTYTSSAALDIDSSINKYLEKIDVLTQVYAVGGYYINATTNKWVKSGTGDKSSCGFFEVKQGQIIAVKSSAATGYAITFVSNTAHTANSTPSYTNGVSGVIVGIQGQTDYYVINTDCYVYYLDYANKYGAYYPRTPEFVGVVGNRIDNIEKQISENISGTGTAITPEYRQGVYNVNTKAFQSSTTRVCLKPVPINWGQLFKLVLADGYRYNVIYFDKQCNVVSALGNTWFTGNEIDINGFDGYFSINISNLYNTDIDVLTFDSLTITRYDNSSSIVNIAQKAKNNFLETHSNSYIGERIDLKSKSFSLENIRTLTTSESYNGVQSLAVWNNLMFIGRAREESNCTSYLLYDLDGFVQKILLPHPNYDAIHANTTCFGEASSYTIPLMYCSQWDGQRACFVYEIDDSYNVTLKRVIDPTNLSTAIFGAGETDWIVGDGYLYSIAYKLNSPYYSADNGLIVCKFALPTGSGVVNLTDADIIEHYEIEPCFIRQDSCYINGKIYTQFGSTGEYEQFKKLFVLDVFKKKVVSICDLGLTTGEPEGLSDWNGELVMMFNSLTGGVYKYKFD